MDYQTSFPSEQSDTRSSSPDEPSFGKAKKEGSSSKGKGSNELISREGPVKAACLNCRAKKAKCDGAKPICGACDKKSLDCQYVKSRRGGARKKREVAPPSALQEYLKKLDGLLGVPDFHVAPGRREPTDDITNIVRQFTSREEIFRCYYNEVHPFMPVMPPRKFLHQILPTLLPQSPFLLAAQAIMTLVPHTSDQHSDSPDSKRLRSACSEAFAQEATTAIERLVETRQTSLECVQALTMLSLWEWGHSGSTTKNRARTGHASQLAMEMGLHDMDKYSTDPKNRALEGENWQRDMARRTWWMTYVNQLISSIITGTTPVLSPDDERIHVDYPVCSIDDESWERWIKTNQQCSRVFGIVNTVYYSHLMPDGGVAAWGAKIENATGEMKEKMREEIFAVDGQISRMMAEAEETAVIELVPGGEEEVVRNQQLSARLGLAVVHIHIHRHQAFPEVSLFSKKICGLPAMNIEPSQMDTTSNPTQSIPSSGDPSPEGYQDEYDDSLDFIGDMWQPESFPESLPQPWFSQPGGAGALYVPVSDSPTFHGPVAASITAYSSPVESGKTRRPSTVSVASNKPHKAWGVDANDKPEAPSSPAMSDNGSNNLFPPGVSLARCATAAHTIVRLEVLHRSAVIALWDGPPKWMPFCACGLVTGAYSFLLLALAVQAESAYTLPSEKALEQINGLLTNVQVIQSGLKAYGKMWAGIDVMASEVQAALDAAAMLPYEIRKQIAAAEMTPAPSFGLNPDNLAMSQLSTQDISGNYTWSPNDPSQYPTHGQGYPAYVQPNFLIGNDPVMGDTINGLGMVDSQLKFQELSPPESNISDGYVVVPRDERFEAYKGSSQERQLGVGVGMNGQTLPGQWFYQ